MTDEPTPLIVERRPAPVSGGPGPDEDNASTPAVTDAIRAQVAEMMAPVLSEFSRQAAETARERITRAAPAIRATMEREVDREVRQALQETEHDLPRPAEPARAQARADTTHQPLKSPAAPEAPRRSEDGTRHADQSSDGHQSAPHPAPDGQKEREASTQSEARNSLDHPHDTGSLTTHSAPSSQEEHEQKNESPSLLSQFLDSLRAAVPAVMEEGADELAVVFIDRLLDDVFSEESRLKAEEEAEDGARELLSRVAGPPGGAAASPLDPRTERQVYELAREMVSALYEGPLREQIRQHAVAAAGDLVHQDVDGAEQEGKEVLSALLHAVLRVLGQHAAEVTHIALKLGTAAAAEAAQEKVESATEEARDELEEAPQELRGRARDTREELQDRTANLRDRLQETVSTIRERVGTARDGIDERMEARRPPSTGGVGRHPSAGSRLGRHPGAGGRPPRGPSGRPPSSGPRR
ncbi:MAG TPA: hypothetical protein VFB58_09350 [Chloroflexota bacterium]|nr:hypothetical protein [Chloroflexota bacterium]